MRPKGIGSLKATGTSRPLRQPKVGRDDLLTTGHGMSSAPARICPHQTAITQRMRFPSSASMEERRAGDMKLRQIGSFDRRMPMSTFGSSSSSPAGVGAHSREDCSRCPSSTSRPLFPLVSPTTSPLKRLSRTKMPPSPAPSGRSRRTSTQETTLRKGNSSATSRAGYLREDRALHTAKGSSQKRRSHRNDSEHRSRNPLLREKLKSTTSNHPTSNEEETSKCIRKVETAKGGSEACPRIVPVFFENNLIPNSTTPTLNTSSTMPVVKEESSTEIRVVEMASSDNNSQPIFTSSSHQTTDEFEWEEVCKDKFSASWETLEEEEVSRPKIVHKGKDQSKLAELKPLNRERRWEEVVFSVHVHVPPNVNPSDVVLPIAKVKPSQNQLPLKKRRKFETPSEIIVLPILTRKHSSKDRNRAAIEPSLNTPSTRVDDGSVCASCQVTKGVDGSSSVSTPDSFFSANSVKKEKNVVINESVSCKVKSIISDADKVAVETETGESFLNVNTTDIESTYDRSTEEEKASYLHIKKRKNVKRVRLTDVPSKCDATTSTHSVTSKSTDVEALHKVISFSEVTANTSVSSMSIHAKKSHELDSVNVKSGVSDIEEDEVNDDEKLTTEECSETEKGTLDSLSAESRYNSSGLDEKNFENRLPILLNQNEKVRKILEKVVSKLEETNERVCMDILEKFKKHNNARDKEIDEGIREERSDETFTIESKEQQNCDSDEDNSGNITSDTCERTKEEVEKETFLKCWQDIPDRKFHLDHLKDDEVTVSEGVTKFSGTHVSESEAEEGDDEADMTSEDVVERHVNVPSTNTKDDPPMDPSVNVCHCPGTVATCPRRPTQNPERSCECREFNEVCPMYDTVVDGHRPSDDHLISQSEHSSAGVPTPVPALDTDGTTAPTHESSTVHEYDTPTLTPHMDPEAMSKPSDDDWIPWTSEDTTEGIPDYLPAKDDTISIITLPPKPVPKTIDIFHDTTEEAVSVQGAMPPWIPEHLRPEDDVPETISEFHWMPEGLRGYSSTIIPPEATTEGKMRDDGRPYLIAPGVSPSVGTTDSSLKVQKQEGGIFSPCATPVFGGELIQVITSAVEKGLAPLRTSIDEIRAKIEKLDTCSHSALKPDILVGVSAVPQCLEQKCTFHSNSVDYTGNVQEVRVPSCVRSMSPYGMVMLRKPSGTSNRDPSQLSPPACRVNQGNDQGRGSPNERGGEVCDTTLKTLEFESSKTVGQLINQVSLDRTGNPSDTITKDAQEAAPTPAPPEFSDDVPAVTESPNPGGDSKSALPLSSPAAEEKKPPAEDTCCGGFCKLPPDQRRHPPTSSLVEEKTPPSTIEVHPEGQLQSSGLMGALPDTARLLRRPDRCKPRDDIGPPKRSASTGPALRSQATSPRPPADAELGGSGRRFQPQELQMMSACNRDANMMVPCEAYPNRYRREASEARSLPVSSAAYRVSPSTPYGPYGASSKQPLSPIAQMYIDLSKSKRSWDDGEVMVAPASPPRGDRSGGGSGGQYPGRSSSNCRPPLAASSGATPKLTLAFPKNMNPLIDVSLNMNPRYTSPRR